MSHRTPRVYGVFSAAAVALAHLRCGSSEGTSAAPASASTSQRPAPALPEAGSSDTATTPLGGTVHADIRALFDAYAKTLNDHRLVESQQFFAASFMVGSPTGSSLATNDAARRSVIANEDDFYKNTLGMTSARITFIEETSLGDHHVFVRTRWGCTFAKTGAKVTDFPLSFIVDRTGPAPKIIVHVVEADEPQMFRDLGLVSP